MSIEIRKSNPLVSSSQSDQSNDGSSYEGALDTIQKVDLPKMYKVLLLNDDFTPMEFVVAVLKRFFNKTEEQATKIMLDVHQKGAGVAGVYSLENAEMKVMQVNQFARNNQHPLKSTMEVE